MSLRANTFFAQGLPVLQTAFAAPLLHAQTGGLTLATAGDLPVKDVYTEGGGGGSGRSKVKNIVIFGAPLTGKTTIANELKGQIKGSNIIEASTDLIHIIANNFDRLPATEDALIARLKKMVRKGLPSDQTKPSRDKAREIFALLKRKYSGAFIAKALDAIYAEKGKTTILSGVRGYQNAVYLKKKGYLVVFLKAAQRDLVRRFIDRGNYSREAALRELRAEERLYSTGRIEREADLIFNTSRTGKEEISSEIRERLSKHKECKRCINTSANPFVRFTPEGFCTTCADYMRNHDEESLRKELDFFRSFIGKGEGEHDIMVGISGGKDSSATLHRIKKMGFTPLAFTLDMGYLHKYILVRAKTVAERIGADYEAIPVDEYLTDRILQRFKRMSDMYKKNDRGEFVRDYTEGRAGYTGVVRPCWVCREMAIHAYYSEALKHGVRVVALGLNEWTALNGTTSNKGFKVSAIRRLKPFKNKPAVYIVHFPFLTGTTLRDTRSALNEIDWSYYKAVQSNAASCLLACAAEGPLFEHLGFHPDTTRLAREVTVGFLTKEEGKKALKGKARSRWTVPDILEMAGLVFRR